MRMIRRLPWGARVGLVFVAVITLVGLFAPVLVTHDPAAVGLASPHQGPSQDFWFGVDRLGRDVYSRIVAGTRRSLVIGFGSVAFALAVGCLLGAIAATSRKAVDETIMRVIDVVMAMPMIVFAAMFIIAFGTANMTVVLLAIGLAFVPQMSRIVRANVLTQYSEDYVVAERVIGAGRPHILIRHVIRNCAAPVLVFATVKVANAIVFEASLSFIGAGLKGEDAASSWGSVLAYGEQLLATKGWWATFFPGLLLLVTVLSLNVLAEGVSDSYAAPLPRNAAVGAATMPVPEVASHSDGQDQAESWTRMQPAIDRIVGRHARRPVAQQVVMQVTDLRLRFPDRHAGTDIIDGVSFQVRRGESLGLVGESGSGKSLTALALMGLQPRGAQIEGSIVFDGREILGISPRARRSLLGTGMAMVYQDALAALNPSMTIEAQLRQLVRRGGHRDPGELLELTGLDARRTLRSYPHELSGGQRQRVVIAMALSRDPQLVIADEPTTALDVTVQARIVDLLGTLQDELGFAMIFISHDLALVSEVCDRVAVMYGGRIVETGSAADILAAPAHHYSRGLLRSVLSLESGDARLSQISGTVPTPENFPVGCRFADRCAAAQQECRTRRPELVGAGRQVACHHPIPVASYRELSWS